MRTRQQIHKLTRLSLPIC